MIWTGALPIVFSSSKVCTVCRKVAAADFNSFKGRRQAGARCRACVNARRRGAQSGVKQPRSHARSTVMGAFRRGDVAMIQKLPMPA